MASRPGARGIELWARAAASGYDGGAQIEAGGKYVSKTKRGHDRTLDRYVTGQLGSMLADSAGLPSHDDAVRVQLSAKRDRRQTLSARSREWLFAGFTCVTGSETKEEDRGEAYYWVRRTLVREGLVVNKHRGNHNFGIQDLTRILLAFWTYDDLVFIHDRYRMQVVHVPHARLLCNRVGVWINAFFADGLRYWRVDADGGWRLVYQLDQRWVKNNRDIENGT
ncbi:uncharacterized protein Z520_11759 [Fonsecaea multimorphosa CBS 102226]|uniref:Uncharacterized protein n=1 Tax=Fonsecaea multimorphosa CBS 102226 TaxID=1442371 RepID=A0A0D2K8C7_9EURO|nr:uncharacterized protein Z520_11759 [Fonsecaea multimorphosa CBS 102226]KIX92583.1 hypothetical protein Z520_11759 [Fonsecaea multimorphosa CBS 102226]